MCAVNGERVVIKRIAQKWFLHFKNRKFNLTDSLCFDQSVRINEDRLNELIHYLQ